MGWLKMPDIKLQDMKMQDMNLQYIQIYYENILNYSEVCISFKFKSFVCTASVLTWKT